MLEEPDLSPDLIIEILQQAYDLQVGDLTFLPLGADVNTAVYRTVSLDGRAYFLKLRKGDFDEITVTLPEFLNAQGLRQIIAPLSSKGGGLWTEFAPYKLILYPFIDGLDGYEISLSDEQWIEFGEAVKRIHSTQLPSELIPMICVESYDPRWRNLVKSFQAQVEGVFFHEPVAAELAAFMRLKRVEINKLVHRAERLAAELLMRPMELVLCHADLHAGNLHLTPQGEMYIVDWDNPLFAPKEHDLMHVGGSALWKGKRIENLFYQGYGDAEIDRAALAYYRCERVIQDIAEFCTQLLSSNEGGKDRQQSLGYFIEQFEAGYEVEIALR